MFHDPHSKVFAVFTDTFVDLVTVHGCDIVDWFSICFARFVSKAGMDVLSPLQSRIGRALEAMRYAHHWSLQQFKPMHRYHRSYLFHLATWHSMYGDGRRFDSQLSLRYI